MKRQTENIYKLVATWKSLRFDKKKTIFDVTLELETYQSGLAICVNFSLIKKIFSFWQK